MEIFWLWKLIIAIQQYYKCTDRQKKLITSSERHSLNFTTSKWIIFGHWQATVLRMKHIWKIRGCFCQKGEKSGEIAKGHFSNITETACREFPRKAAYSKHSIVIHSISKAGYVTAILWFFEKWPSLQFTLFYSFLTQAIFCFLRCAW